MSWRVALRLTSALRLTGAYWILPAAFGLSVFVAISDFSVDTGYTIATYASSSRFVVLLGPLSAAYVVLRIRFHSPFLRSMRSSRNGVALLLMMWWPLVLGFPLTGVLALVSATLRLPNEPGAYEIVVVVVMTTLACTILGILFASAFPAAIAIPLSGGLTFGWLALPGAGTSITIRNMNSAFVGCCSADQQPAFRMIVGSLAVDVFIVSLGIYLVSRAGWVRQTRWAVSGQALLVIIVALVGGQQAVLRTPGELTLLAVEPRDTRLACQGEGQVRICTWPENRSRIGEVSKQAERLNLALAKFRLASVTSVSEGALQDGDVAFRAPYYSTERDIAFSLSVGYGQAKYRCPTREPGAYSLASVAFIALIIGVPPHDVESRVGVDSVDVATGHLREAPAIAEKWFERSICASPER